MTPEAAAAPDSVSGPGPAGRPRVSPRALATGALVALPGALTAYAAFHAGGYFAGTQAVLAVALTAVVVLGITVARDPLAGAGPALVTAAGALALFAAWLLLSTSWSDAPARGLLEFDRALLYFLVLVLFGALRLRPGQLRWMIRGVALAAVAVCAVALLTRLLPHVYPTTAGNSPARLGYPVTYWNALGLLGALGAVLCLHLTCSATEPRAARIAGAAAMPVLACTVYFTYSRGAIAAGGIGLLAYLLLARPRKLVGGLLACVPATVVALHTAYGAGALASPHPAGARGVAEGHHVAAVVAACVVAAALLRGLAVLVAARLPQMPGARRRVIERAVVGTVLAVVLVGGLVAAFAPPRSVRDQYDIFAHRTAPSSGSADPRGRLTDPSSNGRIDQWRIASRAFRGERLHGTGAGTYELLWNRSRPYPNQVVDGHSLYMETLAELGLVGFALIVVMLVALLAGVLARIRGPDRTAYAAVAAVLITWALRAGIDWDWEMPVVTLPVLALAAAALGTAPRRAVTEPKGAGWVPGRTARVLIGLGCLLLAITPARIAVSQGRLNASVRAFKAGDCPRAIAASLDSIDAVGARPQPHALVGYCDARLNQPGLAVRALRRAVKRDPNDWEYRYGLALVLAVSGQDPRAEARIAVRLNPREPLTRSALTESGISPRTWRQWALRAPLPPI